MGDLPLSKHLRGGKECRDNPPLTRVLKRGRGVGEAAAGGSGGLDEGDDVTCDVYPYTRGYGYGFCAGIEMSHRTRTRAYP